MMLAYKTEYVKVDDSLLKVVDMWSSDRQAFKRALEAGPNDVDAIKVAAFSMTNYPWIRLAKTQMLGDVSAMFGTARVHNDVQYHWQTIYHAKKILFHNESRPVCTHRKFAEGGQQQLTNVKTTERLGVFPAIDFTFRALRHGGFCSKPAFVKEWQAFIRKLLKWAKDRVPEEAQSDYQMQSNQVVLKSGCDIGCRAYSLTDYLSALINSRCYLRACALPSR